MMEWQKNKNTKIGIMGGAFNPFHNGHLRHAIEVLERIPLDHIEILPSAHHPHKDGLLPFELRVACVESAIKNIPSLSLNTMENELSAPSYTEKILRAWRKKNPLHMPYFLLGTEDFNVLDTWNNGFEIPTLAHLLIVSRHGGDAKLVCEHAQKYWGDIYISHKNTVAEGIGVENTSAKGINTSDTSINNIDTGDINISSLHNNPIITAHYEKFSPTSNINNTEKLHIAIPNKGFCTYLHIPHIDISATQIRRLWTQKQNLSGLMPESVQQKLAQHTSVLAKYW